MIDKMIITSAKMFKELTNHLHYCSENDCCVRELADKFFDDENSSMGVPGPHSSGQITQSRNQGDLIL